MRPIHAFAKSVAPFLLVAAAACAAPADAPREELLWPQGAPGALGHADADKPSLICFPAAPGQANGAAAVVCPGGAYGILAMEKEGYEVAQWLNGLGVSAFVLKYRLAPYHHPVQAGDGKRAMRWVRAHAADFGVDARRLGMIGFSAGGHLAATVSTRYDEGRPDAADPVDRFSCRPAFQILIYPVITMDAAFTHMGSRHNLLGTDPDPRVVESLSNEKYVTARTPPAFLVHAKTDPVVPFQNSVAYYQALLKAGVPAEFHDYDHGTHAFGLAQDGAGPGGEDLAGWPALCARWLESRGMFRRPDR